MRGGVRENSGRKKLPAEQKKVKMTISVTRGELEVIKTKAKVAGKTISKFIVDTILTPLP